MTRWQKISIAVGIAIVVVIALGLKRRSGARNFFYPLAPPMPAVVSESMPDILAHLESILQTNAPHVLAQLQPGLSADAIAKLEQQYHVQIPDEIKLIYEWHDGSANTSNRLSDDFIPIHRFPSLEETLTEKTLEGKGDTIMQRAAYHIFVAHRDSWICLFDDGSGNGYWFDPRRKPSEGAVFSQFTEDNSFEFFPSAKNLMAGVAKCYESGAFHVKPGSSPPELDENFDKSGKIWAEFGAGNQ
jgi:cell wall assembly regulator SMI1